jgi:hypothetical protein
MQQIIYRRSAVCNSIQLLAITNSHDIIKQCFVMCNSARLGNFTCKFFASCASGYQTKEDVMGRTCNTVGEITNGQTCELGNL